MLVEAHNSISIVERYYTLLRRAYEIILAKLLDLSKDIALQIAFKAINNSARPNSIIPILLIFNIYPRVIEHDVPSPTITQRSIALIKAIDEVYKLRS
jgi:hypothetical protein